MAKKKIRERGASKLDETVELNMTPMIDIVFQMVMFFIIVTDFTQKDIALLELPYSTVGEEDTGEDPNRLIINITAPRPSNLNDPAVRKKWPERKLKQANQILIRNKPYNFVELARFLEQNGVKNPRFREPDNPKLSSRSVLIRCDKLQAFDYVKAILQICAQPDVAIYKIEIATAEQAQDKNGTRN